MYNQTLFILLSGWVGLGCKIKANYSLVGSGAAGGVPSVKVFTRDPSLYLHEFRRESQKTTLGWLVRPEIEPGTSHLPVLSAESLDY